MKKAITVKIGDVEKNLVIQTPGRRQEEKAKMIASKTFAESVDAGCYFKKELNQKLIEHGLLTKEEESLLEECGKKIEEGKTKLRAGGIELSEAKKIAVDMRAARMRLLEITLKLTEHESMTVEGRTNAAYFDALVALCTFDDNGKLLFNSYEHYLDESNEEYAVKVAQTLSSMIYGSTDNWEKDLPENKFLIKYGFMNENFEYIREDGKRVSSTGKLIDENGRYIDEDGNFVDEDGKPVDENGEYIIETSPFLKNGEPV